MPLRDLSRRRGALLWIVVSAAIATAGCVHSTVILENPETRSAEAPAAWKQVRLEGVFGTERTTINADLLTTITFPEPLPAMLEAKLQARIGTEGERPIPLVVENVHYAFLSHGGRRTHYAAYMLVQPWLLVDLGSRSPGGSLGVAADFVIGRGEKAKRIRLEHSVNVAVEDDSTMGGLLAVAWTVPPASSTTPSATSTSRPRRDASRWD